MKVDVRGLRTLQVTSGGISQMSRGAKLSKLAPINLPCYRVVVQTTQTTNIPVPFVHFDVALQIIGHILWLKSCPWRQIVLVLRSCRQSMMSTINQAFTPVQTERDVYYQPGIYPSADRA